MWGSPDLKEVRQARGQMIRLLALTTPEAVQGTGKQARAATDSKMESYQALLNDFARGFGT